MELTERGNAHLTLMIAEIQSNNSFCRCVMTYIVNINMVNNISCDKITAYIMGKAMKE